MDKQIVGTIIFFVLGMVSVYISHKTYKGSDLEFFLGLLGVVSFVGFFLSYAMYLSN